MIKYFQESESNEEDSKLHEGVQSIAAAQLGEANRNAPDLMGLLSNARPIETDESRMFEICFPDYIVYQVRNESYCSYDPAELRRGQYLITFEKS